MATSLAQLLKLVESLTTKDVAYSVESSPAGSTVIATVADDPFVVAELDEKTTSFTFIPQKPAKTASRTKSFEAGGIYNLSKRTGLVGHKPSQLRVKQTLSDLFTRSGWTRAR
jgi:hypothetical protein